MQLAEPHSTRFDLRFSVLGVPVRVHPLFWLITGLLGFSASMGSTQPGVVIALWMAAVFVSILVHELGHAFAARAYGWPPRVMLYSMGGVAAYNPTHRSRQSQIVIALAGPGAGFVLGGLLLGAVVASGHQVTLPSLGLAIGSGPDLALAGGRMVIFVRFLLFVNIFWGLINLMPIQPLDGGTVARATIESFRPRDANRLSLQLSLGAAGVLAIAGLALWRSPFIALMFAWLGYQSWQMLQQLGPARRGPKPPRGPKGGPRRIVH